MFSKNYTRNIAKNRKRNTKNCLNLQETSFNVPHIIKENDKKSQKYKANRHTCLKNTRCYFGQFCNDTSIHGFRFIGERGRYAIERVLWLLVLLGAVSLSGYLIHQAFNRWMSAPVIVTFATRETPIWKIPFPAITICPEIKVQPEIFNYTDVFLKYDSGAETTEEEDQYFNLLSIICNPSLHYVDENVTKVITEDELDKFLNSLADIEAGYCKWLGVDQDCNDVLSYTLTSEGWCRTFNGLDFSEIYVNVSGAFENRTLNSNKAQQWSLEDGYPSDAGLDTYPRRTLLSGAKGGFQIGLFADGEFIDYLCRHFQGFKVTVHHPAEEPNLNNYFRVPLDQAVVVGIKPRLITTTKEVRDYRPEDRQCYLPGEKILTNFRIYTQQNCIAECFWNYTLQTCGCLRFDMHYEFSFTSFTSEENSTEICGAGSNPCVDNATVTFLKQEVASKMDKSEKHTSDQCGCLPACTSVEFETETSQTYWDWRKAFELEGNGSYYIGEKDHYSTLTVYYKEMQFMTSERHELHGTLDFLANCGGLLGLFCGFSVMSIIEILYYLTLRLACNLRKFGRRTWSGNFEVIDEMKNKSEMV